MLMWGPWVSVCGKPGGSGAEGLHPAAQYCLEVMFV